MILTGQTGTDSSLHKTGKRGEHINRGVDTTTVKTTVDVDLSLSNVTSQIRNRMGNI